MAMVHVQQSRSPYSLTVLQNFFSLHSVLGKKKEKKKKSGCLSKRVLILYIYFFLKIFFFLPTVLKYVELN